MAAQQLLMGHGGFKDTTYVYDDHVDYLSVNVPAGATKCTAKVWGAGGEGTGESCSGPYAGGSGGYVQGTFDVVSGEEVKIRVGQCGVGSPQGQSSHGAGRGGRHSRAYYTPSNSYCIAGGGGGSGQAGNGGGGGGNGSGLQGHSSTNNSYIGQPGTHSGPGTGGTCQNCNSSGGTGSNGGDNSGADGGEGGGTGLNQGNRGGGGGAGYHGGGGGGGGDIPNNNCQSGGGGGGSGYITNMSATVSVQGSTGSTTAPNNGDPDYVAGHGGANQHGLVVLLFTA